MIAKEVKLIKEGEGHMYPIEILKRLGGYYNCPKNEKGERLGQLVGYAGTYPDGKRNEKACVGDLYANFAKAEEYPVVMSEFGKDLAFKIRNQIPLNYDRICVVGPEKGGFSICEHIAFHLDCAKAYLEKDITQLKSAVAREQSKLAFKRHSILPGDGVIISEDVSNNFSTTKKAIELIHSKGAKVIAIATILNRSPFVENIYEYEDLQIPVISLVRMMAPEYKQDDPLVVKDIAKGNIIWKAKDEWDKLNPAGKEN
jgi:orotate phosphoribosyltransferase